MQGAEGAVEILREVDDLALPGIQALDSRRAQHGQRRWRGHLDPGGDRGRGSRVGAQAGHPHPDRELLGRPCDRDEERALRSVDRVGRYYPLVITAPLESGWPLLVLPMAGKAWFEQAEQLALMGLDLDRLDLDDFSQQVKALGAPPMATFSVEGAVAGNAWYCPLPEALELALATPLLASDLLRRGLPQISLWWTEGSERVTRCLLICQGLPPVSGFAALLSGEWRHWGWTEKSVANIMIKIAFLYSAPSECWGN